MSKNVRQMLHDFENGMGQLGKERGKEMSAFQNLLGTYSAPNALDAKTKELVSVGISAYNRCEYCIVYHVYNALKHGATRDEVLDAAMVAISFGGGPSMAYTVTLLMDSLDEFEKDFK